MKKNTKSKKHFIKILTIVISLYSIYNITTTQLEIKNKKHQLDIIKEKCEILADYNNEYKHIISIESDQQYIKRISKEKFGLVDQNDRVFIDISSK